MKYVSAAVLSVLLISACADNKSSHPTPTQTTSPTSTTTETPEPVAVHNIQPEEIPQYIENFKAQLSRLNLTLDGQSYGMKFVDFFMEEKQLAVSFDKGIALLGFDFDTNEPLATLTILEGDISDKQALYAAPDRRLTAQNIELQETDTEDALYTGTLVDSATSGVFHVSVTFNESVISGGNSNVVIDGNKASITGELGTNFYVQMQDLIQNHPNVDTLVLQNIRGSVNDDINVHSGRLVRNAMIKTLMPSDGEAYSGGVDLFISGYERIYQPGGVLGVHSWCCVDGKAANELPKDHQAHGAQLTYTREMLGKELGPEFYFFTLDSAAFDGIHNMTQAEITKYFEQPNP